MADRPPAHLLIEEVRKALEAGLPPGFPQKVAANALGIARRELASEAPISDATVARLSARIRAGETDEALVGELIRLSIAKLEIDQPGYPPFRAWQDGVDERRPR